MCLIMAQHAGTAPMPDDEIDESFRQHGHGAGFAFSQRGQLIVCKPYFEVKRLREAYKAAHARAGATSPFVLHFRWATHGSKSAGNTHPHIICKGRAALVHNGIIPIEIPANLDISDTAAFCRLYLRKVWPERIVDPEWVKWMGEAIGPGNKFAIVTQAGKLAIVNEQAGHWEGGRWYSNYSHRVYQSYYGRRDATPVHGQDSRTVMGGPADGYGYGSDWQDELAEHWRQEGARRAAERMGSSAGSLDEMTDDELEEELAAMDLAQDERAARLAVQRESFKAARKAADERDRTARASGRSIVNHYRASPTGKGVVPCDAKGNEIKLTPQGEPIPASAPAEAAENAQAAIARLHPTWCVCPPCCAVAARRAGVVPLPLVPLSAHAETCICKGCAVEKEARSAAALTKHRDTCLCDTCVPPFIPRAHHVACRCGACRKKKLPPPPAAWAAPSPQPAAKLPLEGADPEAAA